MAQRLGQKTVNTFVKGLVTEAGEMTFPDGASIDELNCLLHKDGSRSRRYGLEFQEDGDFYLNTMTTDNMAVTTNIWTNVDGVAGRNFLVVQLGRYVHFYTSPAAPLSDHKITGSVITSLSPNYGAVIDLAAVATDTALVAEHPISVTSSNGRLVIVSPYMDAITVTYGIIGPISINKINHKIRDFKWLGPISTYSNKSGINTYTERQYDTYNAGWFGDKGLAAKDAYYSAKAGWPPLTHPWFSGKDSNGDFSVAEWERVFGGTSLTGNGHFVLDFFNQDRYTACSGLLFTDTPPINPADYADVEPARFSTVTTFSGRVFYAGLESAVNGGKILFTRQINQNNLTDYGFCYQQNDPTAEYFNDLLDTDGGVIDIPDATNIRRLLPINNYLFVFAENGIWTINGVDNVFRATEYAVQKISSIGLFNKESLVVVDSIPIWWSDTGIYSIDFGQTGQPLVQNLSGASIQSFYEDIDTTSRLKAKGVYDDLNKKVYWVYPEPSTGGVVNKNRALVLDIALQAFYPWKFEMGAFKLLDVTHYTGQYSVISDANVIIQPDVFVEEAAGNQVITLNRDIGAESGSDLVFLVYEEGAGVAFAEQTSHEFKDLGNDYHSFAETGYDFIGDSILKKTAPYLIVYCRVTEEGWLNGEAIHPSSLLVSAYWDFSKKASASQQQAYRYKKTPVATNNPNDFGYPDTVIATRLKVRGTGRSMRLRFDSESGKDFHLIGYGIVQGANSKF